MDSVTEIKNKRNCYCDLLGPDYLEKNNIPPGFCGICDTCGKPGHTRHASSGPYTGSWCDSCFGDTGLGAVIAHVVSFIEMAVPIGIIMVTGFSVIYVITMAVMGKI